MTDLAAALRMPLSTATRVVDKLVIKRLLRRTRGKEDRRVIQVVFSRRGQEINRFVAEARLRTAQEMLKSLQPAKRDEFLKIIAIVAAANIRLCS
jgi:DNA-binding MarR family transcriptional regulator